MEEVSVSETHTICELTPASPLVFSEIRSEQATVDFEDLKRLDEEEFLNDNIISFCLRYERQRWVFERC